KPKTDRHGEDTFQKRDKNENLRSGAEQKRVNYCCQAVGHWSVVAAFINQLRTTCSGTDCGT
ncbi:MAG: hypothetical protein ABTQ73_12030, partial [Caldilineales bacterium]